MAIGFHEPSDDRRAVYDIGGRKIGYLKGSRFTTITGRTVAVITRFKENSGLASPCGGGRTENQWWPRIADWRRR